MRFVVIFILSLHVKEFSSVNGLTSQECLDEPWECEESEIVHLETDTCSCGQRTRLPGRIVGGSKTSPYEFPWLTYLLRHKDGGTSGCGSSIINSRMLLTAGHCVTYVDEYAPAIVRKKIPLSNMDVYAHVYNRQEIKMPGEYMELQILHVIVHPKYMRQDNIVDPAQYSNYDIALIVLRHPIDITHRDLNPICLPTETDMINIFERRQAMLAGWGIYDRGNKSPSNYSKKIFIPLHSNKNCLEKYLSATYRMDLFICGDDINHRGAGQGDSGGPLMLETSDNEFLQIGVVSHGTTPNEFAHFNTVTLYSRVTAFIKWIKYHSWGHGATWCKRITEPF